MTGVTFDCLKAWAPLEHISELVVGHAAECVAVFTRTMNMKHSGRSRVYAYRDLE